MKPTCLHAGFIISFHGKSSDEISIFVNICVSITVLPPMKPDQLICLALTIGTAILAGVMYAHEGATLLEAVSFVTGALCVWLTVRESVWNFPISLLNVATFCVVFFRVHLFADAGLQVVYFVLTIVGWYQWLYGGANRTALKVERAKSNELLIVGVCGITLAILLWRLLHYVGGSASFFDALTTSLSLCAQWLLNRKKFETWFFWIAADVIFIPLYAYKGLYLTSALYCVFLCMCVMGLRQWRDSMRRPPIERDRGFEVVVNPETAR